MINTMIILNMMITTILQSKIITATIVGNALIGSAELLTGGGSTLSVTAVGIHNAGDAATYYLQTENILNPNLSEERVAKRRKIAHAIIAALSLSVAAKAGYDLTFDDTSSHNPTAVYSAIASLALNSLLMTTLYRGINRRKREGNLTSHEKDLTKHLWANDVPSAALAVGGAVAQKYGVETIEPIAAVASGLVGAYAFRPTAKNLEHENCVKHDHSHGHGHGHRDTKEKKLYGRHASGEIKKKDHEGRHRKAATVQEHAIVSFPQKRGKRRNKAIAATALVAALGAGASSSDVLTSSSEITSPNVSASTSLLPETPTQGNFTFELPSHPSLEERFVEVPVERGDTQWEMITDAVQEAQVQPNADLVNVLADITAYQNQEVVPNPDHINPEQTIEIPSESIINEVQQVLFQPATNPQLADDMQELNESQSMTKWEKIKKKASVLKRIKDYFTTRILSR